MKLTPNAAGGHFDHAARLTPLLQSYSSPETPEMTLKAYRDLDANERAAYDDYRCARLSSSIAGGIVVKTPALHDLLLELRRASRMATRPIGRTGVILTGPPTAGKTTASFYAMVEGFARHVARNSDWEQLGHVPVVYIEVPPQCTAKSLMGRFLEYLGLPYSSRTTLEERTQLVTGHLVRRKTSLVVIDEMQNLARDNRGHSEALQAIKNLMNAVPAVPLYVGWNLDTTLLASDNLGSQFASRATLVRLGKLGAGTSDERRLWGGVVSVFESKLGLLNQEPKALLQEADYLWTRTRGSLGALARLLTTVALDLIEEGDPEAETITRDRLDSVRLDMNSALEELRAHELEARAKKKVSSRAA